jgi:(1->4)-alpha-D-glucan 1-alpha-D-glucosylmutase
MLLLRRWQIANRSRRTDAAGESLPSRADEYHFYQALIGIWPDSPPSETALESLRERLKAYMLKAVREAKLRTSWINPDTEYEAALERFVVDSLASPAFLKEVNDSVPRIARLGQLVSLSQALLKVASPGVPDYYQGTELFDFSLVDPDNRRPVDYEIRGRYLEEARPDPHALLRSLPDGRAKLYIIRRGLEVRRARPALFQGPRYLPLHADSGREENVVAFALVRNGQSLVAVAPRLFARLMGEGDLAPVGERIWGEAAIALPESLRGEFVDVLTDERHSLQGRLPLARLLGRFPVALLVRG